MKKTTFIALLLVAALCLSLLTACANTQEPEQAVETPDVTNETPIDAPATEAADTPAQSENSEEPEDEAEEDEIIEIEVWMNAGGSDISDFDKVAEAINAITEKEVGVRANFTRMQNAEYTTQLGLAINGGTTIDLCQLMPLNAIKFSTMYNNGQLLDITDAMHAYGQDILNTLGVFIDAATINGRIYGIPNYRLYSTNIYNVMRTDVLEELGLMDTAANLSTFEDLEYIYQAVTDADLGLYANGNMNTVLANEGVLFTGNSFADDTISYDYLESLRLLYSDDAGNVSCVLDHEGYVWMLEKAAEWYQNGYVYPDSMIDTEGGDLLMKQGLIFSEIVGSQLGLEGVKKGITGYDVTCNKLGSMLISTDIVTNWSYGVPVTAEEPEAAIKWYNCCYQNPEIMNLIAWGIEGTHFTNMGGEAAYPEGVTAETCAYHYSDWTFGNQFLILPWSGAGADLRTRAAEDLASAKPSPYLGFSVDTSKLTDALAGLSAVQGEYANMLRCGLYTEEKMTEYQNKLDAADLDGYMAEIQRQLSDWLSSK